jgi:hypothetical protein
LHAEQDADFAGSLNAIEASRGFDAFEPIVVACEERVVAREELDGFEVSVRAAGADSDVEDVDAGLFEGA